MKKELSPADIEEIHRLRSRGLTIVAVAQLFGVSYSRIQTLAPGYNRRAAAPTYAESMTAWLIGEGYYDDREGFMRRHRLV